MTLAYFKRETLGNRPKRTYLHKLPRHRGVLRDGDKHIGCVFDPGLCVYGEIKVEAKGIGSNIYGDLFLETGIGRKEGRNKERQ